MKKENITVRFKFPLGKITKSEREFNKSLREYFQSYPKMVDEYFEKQKLKKSKTVKKII